jgi:hypothetical protein
LFDHWRPSSRATDYTNFQAAQETGGSFPKSLRMTGSEIWDFSIRVIAIIKNKVVSDYRYSVYAAVQVWRLTPIGGGFTLLMKM